MKNNLNINLESIQNTIQETNELEQLVINLLQANLIVHIFHLRITGTGSFAGHLALGDLYEMFSDYADKICEQYQGVTGKLITYPPTISFNLPPAGKEIEYITQILNMVDTFVESYDNIDKTTSNILQDLSSNIRSSLYKLKFLK